MTSQSFYKKTRVQCTLSVKTGTPAASPTYPDPDTGYVAVAGVVVPTGWAAATAISFCDPTVTLATPVTIAQAHDQRMPLRTRIHTVHPNLIQKANYTWDENGYRILSSNASNVAQIHCPYQSNVGRVVGVRLSYNQSIVVNAEFQTGGGNFLQTMPLINTGGVVQQWFMSYQSFEQNTAKTGFLTINQSPVFKLSPPIWTNGCRCAGKPVNTTGGAATQTVKLRVDNISNGGEFNGDQQWYIAEGI